MHRKYNFLNSNSIEKLQVIERFEFDHDTIVYSEIFDTLINLQFFDAMRILLNCISKFFTILISECSMPCTLGAYGSSRQITKLKFQTDCNDCEWRINQGKLENESRSE